MSHLSGYDSEAVGFDSVGTHKRSEATSATQTGDFSESGVGTQTSLSRDCGASATAVELNAQDDILREYPPPGLNEFLRRVVPTMLQQLDEEQELQNNSSDDEEEAIQAKLLQEIKVHDVPGVGSGDQATSVLALSWSSSGTCLAVSLGSTQHVQWCTHAGLVRVYTLQHGAAELSHALDITEKCCVTAVRYHPSVAALLAYGTSSGEVVLCDLRPPSSELVVLSSPRECHGSRRVSQLQWAPPALANTFLSMQIINKGKRRGASDQILISSGSDGTLNVWQVNANVKTFENVVCYNINGSRKMAALDITCFDFIKACPLTPSEGKVDTDIFVVGTSSGALFLCRIKSTQVMESGALDPVFDALEGHATSVLTVSFSGQRPGMFVSVSIHSELRVYDVHQASPLKVFHIDVPISCAVCLPNYPCVFVLGTSGSNVGQGLGTSGPNVGQGSGVVLYNVSSGMRVPVAGLEAGSATALDVNHSGSCRIACGAADSRLHVWELPARRIHYTHDDLDF